MTATQPSALVGAYTCSICRQTLTLKDPILIGEKPAERRNRIGQMMLEHLAQHHDKHLALMFAAGEGFKGYLYSRTFTHNDSDLAAAQSLSQENFRKFVVPAKPIITDQQIEQTVDQHLNLQNNLKGAISDQSIGDLRNLIVVMMKQMRDALTA